MSKWRIKEIFSPKHNKTLYIPQQKGLFFYSSFTYQDYCEYIEKRHNMAGEVVMVWDFPDNRAGFKTVEGAKRMIEYYREYWRILAEHEEAEKEARKKGKKNQTQIYRGGLMKTRIGYYYANAVYTDEDADGLFHTRYGKLTSTNRGCTKIEILDVNIGKEYFELLVCYPGKRDQKWTIYAGEIKSGNERCGWRRNTGHLGFIEVTG